MKILIIIIILLILLFLPVNANDIKEVNIKTSEYPEKTITISQEFNLKAKVLKSNYYKCLDICFCDDEDKSICEDTCKYWCYHNYEKLYE